MLGVPMLGFSTISLSYTGESNADRVKARLQGKPLDVARRYMKMYSPRTLQTFGLYLINDVWNGSLTGANQYVVENTPEE